MKNFNRCARTVASFLAVSVLICGCGQTATAAKNNTITKDTFEKTYNLTNLGSADKVILDMDFFYLNDDCYTLFEALQAHDAGYIDFLGITTAGGNVLASAATYDVLSMLDYLDHSDIPVYVGTDVPLNGFRNIAEEKKIIGQMDYIGAYSYLDQYVEDYHDAEKISTTKLKAPVTDAQEENASDFMIEQVRNHPGEVTIFALGGYTNIAKAIQKDPTFAQNAKGIVYMGGVFDVPGEELPNLEINWWYDPEAVDICLHAGWKDQLIVPHDAAVTCLKGKDMYELYKSKNTNKMTNLIVDSLAPIYENDQTEFLPYCWDSLTVAVFLCPDLILKEELRDVIIETKYGHFYGSPAAYSEGKGPDDSVTIKIVFSVDREKIWSFISDLYALDSEQY